ncbi:MAG: hypothetical protein HYZ49_17825, partial [Chloroflexi bacterium]|nr:hypothetical protein [Chloroflexota bacterium]
MEELSLIPPGLPERMKLEEHKVALWLPWLLSAPCLLVMLLTAGQIALFLPRQDQAPDTRSQLAANYAPWPFTIFAPVSPDIVQEIIADQGLDPNVLAVIPGTIWLQPPGISLVVPTPLPSRTATSTPTPTPTPTSTSSGGGGPTATTTPIITPPPPTNTLVVLPTSTPTLFATVTQTVTLIAP